MSEQREWKSRNWIQGAQPVSLILSGFIACLAVIGLDLPSWSLHFVFWTMLILMSLVAMRFHGGRFPVLGASYEQDELTVEYRWTAANSSVRKTVSLTPDRIIRLSRREYGLRIDLKGPSYDKLWLGHSVRDWRSLADLIEQRWEEHQQAAPAVRTDLPAERVAQWLGIEPDGVYRAGSRRHPAVADARGLQLGRGTAKRWYGWSECMELERHNFIWVAHTPHVSVVLDHELPGMQPIIDTVQNVVEARQEGHVAPWQEEVPSGAISRLTGEPEAAAELGLSRHPVDPADPRQS